MTPTELDRLRKAASARSEAVAEIARRICETPAPTGSEQVRAELVAALWRERGYAPAIDPLGNVYVRRGQRGQGPVLMLLAHMDTVFPYSTPIAVERDGDILRGPGIGDNSLSVAAMLHTLDVLDALKVETAVDIVAVADVGEEGLGNLCGARAAVERYRAELGAIIVIDGHLGQIVHTAVGSMRWRITVSGPGGHSFGDFGVASAIHELSRIIAAIADIQVPQEPKTTFNVGTIEGGTSVNTIAAHASALLDMRSTDVLALERLANQVREIIRQHAHPGLQAEFEILGVRPAGRLSHSEPLLVLAAEVLRWLGIEPEYSAASTDANIPLSLHIPTVCIGITHGSGAHTLREHIEVAPISDGLAQLARLCIEASTLLARQA
jgi:tripeptide aminopeptidase